MAGHTGPWSLTEGKGVSPAVTVYCLDSVSRLQGKKEEPKHGQTVSLRDRRQGQEFGSAHRAGIGAGGTETKLQRAAEKVFVFSAER